MPAEACQARDKCFAAARRQRRRRAASGQAAGQQASRLTSPPCACLPLNPLSCLAAVLDFVHARLLRHLCGAPHDAHHSVSAPSGAASPARPAPDSPLSGAPPRPCRHTHTHAAPPARFHPPTLPLPAVTTSISPSPTSVAPASPPSPAPSSPASCWAQCATRTGPATATACCSCCAHLPPLASLPSPTPPASSPAACEPAEGRDACCMPGPGAWCGAALQRPLALSAPPHLT